MRGEGRGTLECLPTHLAFKTSFLGVNIGVLLQAYSMPEGFATYFTSKGPGPTMRPSYMDLQAMGSGEYLVALHTVVGLHVGGVMHAVIQRGLGAWQEVAAVQADRVLQKG